MDHEPHSTDRAEPVRHLDPVCGMVVEPVVARARNLVFEHAGVDYFFCGRGCRLDFEDDPARYLDPGYTPSM
jgi:YHS domain-containing protein